MLYRFIRSLRANITFLKIQYDLEYGDIPGTHSLFEVICGSHEYTSRIWKILIFLQTKIESSSREDLYVRSVRTIHYDMHMICI